MARSLACLRQWYDRYSPVLQNKPYTSLLSAAFFSLVGDLIAANGAMWALASSSEHAAIYVTALVIATRIAFVVFSPITGYVIDRYGPLPSLTGAIALRAMCMTLLVLSMFQLGNGFGPWVLVVLLAIDSAVTPITRQAEFILTQVLVPEQHLTPANALQGIQFDLAFVVGPLLGGLLNVKLGIQLGIAVNVVSFGVYLLTVLHLRKQGAIVNLTPSTRETAATTEYAKEELPKKLGFKTSLLEGASFLRKTPALLWLVLLGFAWNLFIFGPIDAIYPILTKAVFREGAFGLGLLTASNSAGFIIGLAIIGGVHWKWPSAVSNAVALALHGIIYVLVGLSPTVWGAAGLLFVGGVITGPTDVFSKRIRQKLVPIEMQGRVSAVSSALGFLGGPLGATLVGVMLNTLGEQVAGHILVASGLLLFLSAFLIAFRREMRSV